jgi:alkylation response protein AidB-like acyl-CoA dehydrogenase
MIAFELSEQQLDYRRAAREFADSEIRPYAAELDRRQDVSFDWGIVRRLSMINALGLAIPTEYGGLGLDNLTCSIIAEELGAACAGTTIVAGATWLATTSINLVGTEDQKRRYFPRLLEERGNLAALAVTEQEAGSDLASMTTSARKEGDHYILNGRKAYISNAGLADFYVVFATSDPKKRHAGLNAFIVDGDSEGLTGGEIEEKMGLRASQTGEVLLEDVAVPADNLLGEENAGFLVAVQTLDSTRPCLGAVCVGLAREAFEIALDYARERKQYGKPIFENQAISFMLADMATEIDAARLLTWRASWLIDQGMDSTKASSMCKTYASEMAEQVCSRAMQILGANGYTRKWPVEKLFRDAKAFAIFEGTNQIQRIIISSML